MRIISQDKMIDIPYEMTVLHMSGETIRMNMIGETGRGTIMASYSTPEKAKVAMRLLQEAYVVHENFRNIDGELQIKIIEMAGLETGLIYGGIFKFPQDDEIDIISVSNPSKNQELQTNANRIRHMTDEELSKIIMCPYNADPGSCHKFCSDCCLEWLQKPCEIKAESKRRCND